MSVTSEDMETVGSRPFSPSSSQEDTEFYSLPYTEHGVYTEDTTTTTTSTISPSLVPIQAEGDLEYQRGSHSHPQSLEHNSFVPQQPPQQPQHLPFSPTASHLPPTPHRVKLLSTTASGFASPTISGRLVVVPTPKEEVVRVFHEPQKWAATATPKVDTRWVPATPGGLGGASTTTGGSPHHPAPLPLPLPLEIHGGTWEGVASALGISPDGSSSGGSAAVDLRASLRSLTLTDCSLTPATLALLPPLPALVHLDLSDNPLEGLGAFSDLLWLQFAPNLEELRLRGCGLKAVPSFMSVGVGGSSSSSSSNKGLKTLDLSCNYITSTETLASLSRSLRSLDLSCNDLHTASTSLRPLSALLHLQHLTLHPNPITLSNGNDAAAAASSNSGASGGLHGVNFWYRTSIIDLMPALSTLDGIPTPPSHQQRQLVRELESREVEAALAAEEAAKAAKRASRPYGSRSLTDTLYLPPTASLTPMASSSLRNPPNGTTTMPSSPNFPTFASKSLSSSSNSINGLGSASEGTPNPALSTPSLSSSQQQQQQQRPATATIARLASLSKPVQRAPPPPPPGALEEEAVVQEQRARSERLREVRRSRGGNRPSWCWMNSSSSGGEGGKGGEGGHIRDIILAEVEAATRGDLEGLIRSTSPPPTYLNNTNTNTNASSSSSSRGELSAGGATTASATTPATTTSTAPLSALPAPTPEYLHPHSPISHHSHSTTPTMPIAPHPSTPRGGPHYSRLRSSTLALLTALTHLLEQDSPGRGVLELKALAVRAEESARDVLGVAQGLEGVGVLGVGRVGKLVRAVKGGVGRWRGGRGEGVKDSTSSSSSSSFSPLLMPWGIMPPTEAGQRGAAPWEEDGEGGWGDEEEKAFELEGYLVLEGVGKEAAQALLHRHRAARTALLKLTWVLLSHADEVRRLLVGKAEGRVVGAGEVAATANAVGVLVASLRGELRASSLGVLLGGVL